MIVENHHATNMHACMVMNTSNGLRFSFYQYSIVTCSRILYIKRDFIGKQISTCYAITHTLLHNICIDQVNLITVQIICDYKGLGIDILWQMSVPIFIMTIFKQQHLNQPKIQSLMVEVYLIDKQKCSHTPTA